MKKLLLLLFALFTTIGTWASTVYTVTLGDQVTDLSNLSSSKNYVLKNCGSSRYNYYDATNSQLDAKSDYDYSSVVKLNYDGTNVTIQQVCTGTYYQGLVDEARVSLGASSVNFTFNTDGVSEGQFRFANNSLYMNRFGDGTQYPTGASTSFAGNFSRWNIYEVTITETTVVDFDPSDVAGKTFTLQCARGYVYYNGTQLAGTSTASNASKFAIVSYDSNTYLYDVTNNAFVCHTTAATAGTTGNAALESDNDFSKAVKNISFGSTNIDAYPYYIQENEFTNWLNMDGAPRVYFNRWTNFEGGNGGNTYKIVVVDTDFDQSAAAEMLDNYFNPSATVTYVISDASGVIYTSEAMPATVSETITALPSDLQRPYCTYSVTSTTVVAGNNNVPVTVTYNPPFTVSSDFATATWYYATLRGKQLRADENHKDSQGRYQTNSSNERTDVYKWAFVGNPYELSIINKGAGDSKVLYAGDVAVMQAATPSSDNKARWIVSSNSNGGFSVRSESGATLYINDAAQGGNMGYWNSSAGANDSGSNWVVSEVTTSDKNALAGAIATAQALVATPGVPGYINSSAAATLSEAISTAQSVYDDPAGDYASAYNTLAAAIAVAGVPANINYTPRTDVYYTIVNSRGAMVYDPSHDESVDVTSDNAKYIWYGSTTPDASEPNNLWGFVERGGNYYMYNVGKRQFATVGTGTYGATWIFSNTPAYITLDDGIADEIVPPGVRVRATIATTSQSYTMSVSTGYTGPVITYDANGDGGVPMTFAESSYAIDAEVTAAIESLIDDPTPYREALQAVIDGCASISLGTGLNQYAANSTYTDALSAANTACEDAGATISELQTATVNLENAIAGLTLNLPATGKFYRIKGYSGNYITSIEFNTEYTTATNAVMDGDASADNIVYYNADGNIIFYGTGYGLYETSLVAPVGSALNSYTFSEGAQKGHYYIKSNYSGSKYCYDNTGNGTKLDRNGSPVTSGSYQTDWTLEEVTSLPVDISSDSYTSFSAPVAVTIPDNCYAYIATGEGDGVINMTKVTGNVAANTGMIISTDGIEIAGPLSFEIAESGTKYDNNWLVANVAAANIPAEVSDDNYFFGKVSDKYVFTKLAGVTEYALRGYKAYMHIGGSAARLSINWGGDDATGLSELSNEVIKLNDGKYYQNGTVIVVRNGVKYNVAGQTIK